MFVSWAFPSKNDKYPSLTYHYDMVEQIDGFFHIYTENTSYVFNTGDTGYPEHIYWGRRIKNPLSAASALSEKHMKAPVMSTISDRSYSEFSLDDTLL